MSQALPIFFIFFQAGCREPGNEANPRGFTINQTSLEMLRKRKIKSTENSIWDKLDLNPIVYCLL